MQRKKYIKHDSQNEETAQSANFEISYKHTTQRRIQKFGNRMQILICLPPPRNNCLNFSTQQINNHVVTTRYNHGLYIIVILSGALCYLYKLVTGIVQAYLPSTNYYKTISIYNLHYLFYFFSELQTNYTHQISYVSHSKLFVMSDSIFNKAIVLSHSRPQVTFKLFQYALNEHNYWIRNNIDMYYLSPSNIYIYSNS